MDKKIRLFICISLVSSLFALGQTNVTTVSYENESDKTSIEDLMELMEIQNIKININNSDLRNKDILLEEVVCSEGKFGNKIFNEYMPLNIDGDTLEIRFLSIPVNSDSVKILIKTPTFGYRYIQKIPAANALLVELNGRNTYSDCDTIPIISYSTGIPESFIYNGETAVVYDICGLRDSEVSPYDFFKIYGIKNYFFFNLILKEKE